jgi:hypothetical protein
MISDLQEQETILKHCIAQLGSVDAVRISLINQLKEALTEQVLKHTSIIFQTFHLSYIWLMFFFKIVVLISITGVKVRGSSQPVASKNYSLCTIAWWLFICCSSLHEHVGPQLLKWVLIENMCRTSSRDT